MILHAHSFVKQIEYGKKYSGHFELDGKRFNYYANVYEKESYEPESVKLKVEVTLFDTRWQRVHIHERVVGILKCRIAGDVLEFYSAINNWNIDDDALLGGVSPKNASDSKYKTLESQLQSYEDYRFKTELPEGISERDARRLLGLKQS